MMFLTPLLNFWNYFWLEDSIRNIKSRHQIQIFFEYPSTIFFFVEFVPTKPSIEMINFFWWRWSFFHLSLSKLSSDLQVGMFRFCGVGLQSSKFNSVNAKHQTFNNKFNQNCKNGAFNHNLENQTKLTNNNSTPFVQDERYLWREFTRRFEMQK